MPVNSAATVFAPTTKHLVVFAHQDDELPYAGLLARMNAPSIVFTTNGDGLHFERDMAPEPYAELRRQESLTALERIGITAEQIHFLGHSELTYYAAFGAMSERAEAGPTPPPFEALAEEVDTIVQTAQPDVVWTMAWQGGNPEHDLTHLCVSRAVKTLNETRDTPARFFELPAYELLVLVMRFGRWYDGKQHEIRLTPQELAAKKDMLDMYPTQERVITELRRAIGLVNVLQRLRGRRYSFDDFGSREVYGEVPAGRDFTRSTHLHPRLDYPLDDWQGQRIRFERTLARLGSTWKHALY